MPRRISIRAHLLRLALAVALPLAALGAWNLYATAQADSQRARDQVYHLAQVTASQTANFLGQAHNILNGLARRPAVRALDASRCDPILQDFLGLAPRFANLATMAMDGRVICSAVPLAGPARGAPERFLNLMRDPDELTVGKAAPGVITGRWVVPLGRPLLDAQGGVAGAVVLAVDLRRLPALPSLEGLPQNAIVGIIDADGMVLARSSDAERFVGTQAGAGRLALERKQGTADVIGIDGIPRIQGFTPVAGTGWIAIASLPASDVYAGVNVRIATSIVLAIAILALTLLLALRWSREIRNPIVALAGAASEVAAGNLAPRAPVAGAAEIAEVATQFNRMLDARVHAETLLRDTEEKLRLFVHFAPASIAMFDRDMRYIAYSQRWITDYKLVDQGDITGCSHYEIFPELPERWKEIHRKCLAGAIERADADPFPREDGSVDWVRWEVHPWHAAAGGIGGIIIFSEVITERKRAEETTREAERRLSTLIGNLPGLAYRCRNDAEFTTEFVSDGVAELTGYPADEFRQRRRHYAQAIHPGDQEEVRRTIDAALDQRRPFELTYRIVTATGAEKWVWEKGQGVFDARGQLEALEGFVTDITERKHAENALRETAERINFVIEGTQTGTWDWDLATNRVRYSREWKRMLGYEEHEVADHLDEWRRLAHPDEIESTLAKVNAYLRQPSGTLEAEFRMRHKSGEYRWIQSRAAARLGEGEKPLHLLGLHVDITARKQAEEALRESSARLEALTRRLLEVQETERRSIARELHDEVGSALTAVSLNLQSLRGKRSGDPGDAALADGIELVAGAIRSVRSLSLDLRPVVLDDLGLIPALNGYCERQALRAGIPIELALDAIDLKPAPHLESACFRIVQESVTNALRHANARRIQVTLRRADHSFVIEVADDGGGFDVAAARLRGLAGESSGLLGMEERAKLLGGRLAIDSARGAGARVRAEFPVPDAGFG